MKYRYIIIGAVFLFLAIAISGCINQDSGTTTTSLYHPNIDRQIPFPTPPTNPPIIENPNPKPTLTLPTRPATTTTLSNQEEEYYNMCLNNVADMRDSAFCQQMLATTTTIITSTTTIKSDCKHFVSHGFFNHTKAMMCKLGYQPNNVTAYAYSDYQPSNRIYIYFNKTNETVKSDYCDNIRCGNQESCERCDNFCWNGGCPTKSRCESCEDSCRNYNVTCCRDRDCNGDSDDCNDCDGTVSVGCCSNWIVGCCSHWNDEDN